MAATQAKFTLQHKGIILVMVLLLMIFIAILGLSFLTFVSDDYHFAGKQVATMSAFYLAKAGMEYYGKAGLPSEPIHIPSDDPHHFCAITRDPVTGDITFTGTITNFTGKIAAQRVIVAPGGSLTNWYEK